MAFYLYQVAYTPEAIRGMVAHPQDRATAARNLVEGLGGTLHHIFFAFGEYDIVCLIEGPDDTMMAAGALAVAAAGTCARSKTTKLLTTTEAMEAMKRAGQATGYTAPHA
jgi:uncharacterized protein with GYD domain